jgi:hypothetical protein
MNCKAIPSGLRCFDGSLEAPEYCPLAQRIQELAQQFPLLPKLPGIDPWSPEQLLLQLDVVCSGTRHAILFLLSVWNPNWHQDNTGEPFDLHAALKVWDEAHHEAFLSWVEAPWWP